jgi:peptidoglycan hydrolase-like protein with peptidoglycan-binding domain
MRGVLTAANRRHFMHKAVLAAVAAAALFAPAVAQQMDQHPMDSGQSQNGQSQSGQEPQAQQLIPGLPQALAGRAIAPELLSARQIRDIQQALEARGARSIRVDGQWGADIEAAIRNFQQTENMIAQNGELDPLTLMALGLNPMSFGLSGMGETTGQAVRDGAAPREPMQEAPDQPMREQPIREQER